MSLSMSLGNTKLEMTKLNFRKKNPRSSIFFTCQIRFQNLIVFWSFTACFKQTNGTQGNLAKKTLLCFCLIIILNKYPWNPKMLPKSCFDFCGCEDCFYNYYQKCKATEVPQMSVLSSSYMRKKTTTCLSILCFESEHFNELSFYLVKC